MNKTNDAFKVNVPQLLLISNTDVLNTQKNMHVFEEVLAGGVDAVLLREHAMDDVHLLAVAAEMRVLTRHYQAKLLIHSHADIAQAVGADGVHVSAKQMFEIVAMKAWLQQKMLFSVSCHNEEELRQAKNHGADFSLLSPVFATQSHPNAAVLGVDVFKKYAAQSPLPVIALGGVDVANRHFLAGFGVACMRGLLLASEPTKEAGLLQER